MHNTYVPTWSGFVCVVFAIDLYSRAIVGWSASTCKDAGFVEQCPNMALWRRDHTDQPVLPGMIHHWAQAASTPRSGSPKPLPCMDFQLRSARFGDAYDNTATESTGGLYQNDAVAAGSPFRTGPLRTFSDVETLTMNYLHW